jgi:transposase
MQESQQESEFHLVVTGVRRNGRRRYDAQSKEALARACLQPGVSLAGMALKHGVNANLLRKWVVQQKSSDAAALTMSAADPGDAFVQLTLNNGSSAKKICQGERRPVRPAVVTPPVAGTAIRPPARLRAQLPNGGTFEVECAQQRHGADRDHHRNAGALQCFAWTLS